MLNGAGGNGSAALLLRDAAGLRSVQQAEQAGRGAEALPALLLSLLGRAGWEVGSLGLIAAVTGPGSFTGLRATLALAQGLALGTGAMLHGVASGEALRHTVATHAAGGAHGLPLWCVTVARRDRVFLERAGDAHPQAFMLEALPVPVQPVLLAGDAAETVAAALARAGARARCSGVTRPDPVAVAALALYVDPPLARAAPAVRPPPGSAAP